MRLEATGNGETRNQPLTKQQTEDTSPRPSAVQYDMEGVHGTLQNR